jgi:hypothetical protein
MSRTPARFTQADYARAIRAAKQAGAAAVEFRPDVIRVDLSGESTAISPEAEQPESEQEDVVL